MTSQRIQIGLLRGSARSHTHAKVVEEQNNQAASTIALNSGIEFRDVN